MHGTGIDKCHQAELADAGQPPHRGRVEERPHAGRERHGDPRGNPHALRVGFKCHQFRQVCQRHGWLRGIVGFRPA